MLMLLTLAALAFQATEPDLRGEIEIRVGGLGASPNGDLWVVTPDGRAYVSRDRHQTWTEVELATSRADERGHGGDRLCAIDFVDAQRAVISGDIGDENTLALRTADGGSTWLPVAMPEPLVVWDTCVDADGNLWLTGYQGALLVTRDGGTTFETVESPFGEQSCSQVFFESAARGVASTLAGSIRLTEDGGAHWRDVSDPLAGPDNPEKSVEELALFGDRLVVVDRESVRTRRLGEDDEWEPLAVESRAIRGAAACSTGLVALLEDGRIVRFSRDLIPAEPHRRDALGNHLVQMKATPSVALFDLNARGDIGCFDDQGFVQSRMLTPPGSTDWPLQYFDGGSSGPRFGTTDGGLYRSPDGGRTWERRADAASMGPIFAFEDGTEALVLHNERVAIWRDEARQFENLAVFDPMNAELRAFRRGQLWLAWGYHYVKNPQGAFSTHTASVGPEYTALVFGSIDGGRTWTRLLEERGCTIVASFLGDDDVLSLLLSDESVLRGKLSLHVAPSGARVLTFARGLPGLKLIRGPVWGWIEFVAGERGSLGGSDFFAGTVLQTTEDAGRTWIDASTNAGLGYETPTCEIHRLGSGLWARTLDPWEQPGSVELWREGTFQPARSFESEIHDQRVDAAGRLIVRLANSQVWALSADGAEWTQLPDLAVPAR